MSTTPLADADALFPKARREVIGLLFGHPDQEFYLREIVEATGLGLGHVQRELARLSAADILTRVQRGRSVFFQANPECPIFEELRGIAIKTTGAAAVLRRAMAPLANRIRVAFIFGSVARREQKAESDVDLLVIGDVSFADVVGCIRETEAKLRREVNPVVYSPTEASAKLATRNHFLTKVLASEKLYLVGGDDELLALPTR